MLEVQKAPEHWIVEDLVGEQSSYGAIQRQNAGRSIAAGPYTETDPSFGWGPLSRTL